MLRNATGRNSLKFSAGILASDEEHHPAEHNRRSDEECKAVGAIANHALRRIAHGDAEDRRSAEGEKQNRGKVGGMEHQLFLPVRRLCASTAAMMLRRPATTINFVP